MLLERWDHQGNAMDYEMLSEQIRSACQPAVHFAVLIPVWEEKENGLSLLFEVRAHTLRRQPDEICFPGGRVEEKETPLAAALRETQEELGLSRLDLESGPPLPLDWHPAGFFTAPFLARLAPDWQRHLAWNPDEVADVFCVPLNFFLETPPELYFCDLEIKAPADFPARRLGYPNGYPWRTGRLEVPIWTWEGKSIWGMTARMIRTLVRVL